MRADLNKLLCERERRGGFRSRDHHPYRHMKRFAPDTDPEEGGPAGQESMTRRYGYDGKEFNENLRPLYGQVRRAVGRRWDAFYSDLCKVFDMRSVINQHILQHLKDYCEREIYLRDGALFIRRAYGPDKALAQDDCEFYVDPRDGIIKRNKYRTTYRQMQRARLTEEKAAEAKVTRWVDESTVLRKVGDTWFIFDVLPMPEASSVFDRFLQKYVMRNHWGPKVYHCRRRTASRKLLKQHEIVA